jgi:meso-butanediol dehydrogenase/(S,S)-butanediol dehydrogenase/diacetyl reductase
MGKEKAMGLVDGKTIIVTGSAQGIGAAIAKDLANEGGHVVVADFQADAAEAVASSIRGGGGSAISIFVDVSKRDSVKNMIEKTVLEFGALDIIFNNAGIASIVPFLDLDEETWERTMRVNALGVLLCTQEAAKQMIKQGKGGKIVNTSSVGGKQAYPVLAHYNASKFAVGALTQAAARSFGEHNITVNCFAPGIVATDLWQGLDAEFLKLGIYKHEMESMADYSKQIILGRHSTPADIVGVTRFLASSQSDYVTGQTVMVDGGMVLI